MKVRFTWDPTKARTNQRLHGISFETAKEAFDDPHHLVGESYFVRVKVSSVTS